MTGVLLLTLVLLLFLIDALKSAEQIPETIYTSYNRIIKPVFNDDRPYLKFILRDSSPCLGSFCQSHNLLLSLSLLTQACKDCGERSEFVKNKEYKNGYTRRVVQGMIERG